MIPVSLHRRLAQMNMDESRLIRKAIGATPGLLLEVGAHEGDETLMEFASRDWDIHAFEPDPANRIRLDQRVRDYPNVVVVGKAVSDKAGTTTLYRSDESTGISSLTPFTASHTPATEVETVTLRDYLSENEVERVDYLKVDVEGYERFVLDGYPWATHRPRVVLLEFEDRKTQPLGYGWTDLADHLVGHGYVVLVSEWFPIVRYGALHQWRRLVPYPCALADSEAWGNLIATDPATADRVLRANRRAAPYARALSRLARIKRRVVPGSPRWSPNTTNQP